MALKETKSKEKNCFKFCIYARADLEGQRGGGPFCPSLRIQISENCIVKKVNENMSSPPRNKLKYPWDSPGKISGSAHDIH